MKVMLVFGTQPEAIKMCPLVNELKARPEEFETLFDVTCDVLLKLKPVLEAERPDGVAAGTLELVGTDELVIYRVLSRLLSDEVEYAEMSSASNPTATVTQASGLRTCCEIGGFKDG